MLSSSPFLHWHLSPKRIAVSLANKQQINRAINKISNALPLSRKSVNIVSIHRTSSASVIYELWFHCVNHAAGYKQWRNTTMTAVTIGGDKEMSAVFASSPFWNIVTLINQALRYSALLQHRQFLDFFLCFLVSFVLISYFFFSFIFFYYCIYRLHLSLSLSLIQLSHSLLPLYMSLSLTLSVVWFSLTTFYLVSLILTSSFLSLKQNIRIFAIPIVQNKVK